MTLRELSKKISAENLGCDYKDLAVLIAEELYEILSELDLENMPDPYATPRSWWDWKNINNDVDINHLN